VERYSVFIKPSAIREIEAIDKKRDRQRIVRRIRQLATDPRPSGCEYLSRQNKYRIRQGVYRIVYSIEDRKLVVHVVAVGHRKDVNK
jgi:mRNA interferase RelE/StbE